MLFLASKDKLISNIYNDTLLLCIVDNLRNDYECIIYFAFSLCIQPFVFLRPVCILYVSLEDKIPYLCSRPIVKYCFYSNNECIFFSLYLRPFVILRTILPTRYVIFLNIVGQFDNDEWFFFFLLYLQPFVFFFTTCINTFYVKISEYCRSIRQRRRRQNPCVPRHGFLRHHPGTLAVDCPWVQTLRFRCGRFSRRKWSMAHDGFRIRFYSCKLVA